MAELYLCTARTLPASRRGGGTVQGKAVSTAGKEYTVVDHSTEDYMGILALTQFATFYTCREAAKRMRAQGNGGRIIIIGSVMSNFAAKGSAAYSGERQPSSFPKLFESKKRALAKTGSGQTIENSPKQARRCLVIVHSLCACRREGIDQADGQGDGERARRWYSC